MKKNESRNRPKPNKRQKQNRQIKENKSDRRRVLAISSFTCDWIVHKIELFHVPDALSLKFKSEIQFLRNSIFQQFKLCVTNQPTDEQMDSHRYARTHLKTADQGNKKN